MTAVASRTSGKQDFAARPNVLTRDREEDEAVVEPEPVSLVFLLNVSQREKIDGIAVNTSLTFEIQHQALAFNQSPALRLRWRTHPVQT